MRSAAARDRGAGAELSYYCENVTIRLRNFVRNRRRRRSGFLGFTVYLLITYLIVPFLRIVSRCAVASGGLMYKFHFESNTQPIRASQIN